MITSKSTVRRAIRRSAHHLSLAVLAAGMSAIATSAAAWDGAVSGTIVGVDSIANEGNNYELRVYLSGVSTYCTTTATYAQGFAYMNSADTNYKGTLATLLTAYTTGKQVTLYTMNDGGAGCHLHYVQVR